MQKAILFCNFTDEPFSHTWDSVPYNFPPGQKFMMEDWKARHFAKHLANFVLNKQGKSVADPSHKDLMKKAMPDEGELVAVSESEMTTKLLNHEQTQSPVKKGKGGRPQKSAAKPMDEETFEGVPEEPEET